MAAKRSRQPLALGAGPPRRRRQRSGTLSQKLAYALLGSLFGLCLTVAALWFAASRSEIVPRAQGVILTAGTRREVAQNLEDAGVLRGQALFLWYWTVFHPFTPIETGPHFLAARQSLPELILSLTRSPTRRRVRVTLPEGWSQFQVAERLRDSGICSKESFLEASRSETVLRALGLTAPSSEGYLFPDTYDFFTNSRPSAVLERLVSLTQRKIAALEAEAPQRFAELKQGLGFGIHEIITLASVIEKETQNPSERAKVASVFFNRLTDAKFFPRRMLQSDPTAGYGCLLYGAAVPSCNGYSGRVSPEMLRDPSNPYNTYKHAGLPPGPIANPGLLALRAVLDPELTPYLFFVADGHGSHVFSRTLEEHEAQFAPAK